MNKLISPIAITILVLSAFSMSSCRVGNVTYFNNIKDSIGGPTSTLPVATFEDPKIKPYDQLVVDVHTLDVTPTGGASKTESLMFSVDKAGFVELPVLGRIKVAELSLFQAKEKIREEAGKYYVNPTVNLNYANFYVTVLGDVAVAGKKTFSTEKVTILDALGESRDLAISGKRENVLVVREENGHKSYGRLNLNSTDIYTSPYYYMRSGDLVYVEPNLVKAKTATTDYSRDKYISYLTTFLSLGLSIFSVVIVVRRENQ